MVEETLELLILGHIAKELKDEIQSDRQVKLAKTITQALHIHDVVGRQSRLCKECQKRIIIEIMHDDAQAGMYD